MQLRLVISSFAVAVIAVAGCVKESATRAPAISSAVAAPAQSTAPPAASSAPTIAVAPLPPSIRCANTRAGDLRCSFRVIDADARAAILSRDSRDRLGLFCERGVTQEQFQTVESSPGNVVSLGLDSGCQDVRDLRAAAVLKNLRSIELRAVRIQTLAPLASLYQLETVVASNLHDLTDSDLSMFSHAKMLTSLDLTGTASIVDISALAQLPSLEVLDLSRTSVKSIEPLGGVKSLKTLRLGARVSNLAPLEGLVQLNSLELAASPVADLSPLKKLVHLEHLVASNVGLHDLTVLAGLKDLQTLSVSHNRDLASLAPLAGLRKLSSLTVSDSAVKDLTPLAALPALVSLDVRGTAVTDVAPLMRIKTLKRLSVPKAVPKEKLDALKKQLPGLQIAQGDAHPAVLQRADMRRVIQELAPR